MTYLDIQMLPCLKVEKEQHERKKERIEKRQIRPKKGLIGERGMNCPDLTLKII